MTRAAISEQARAAAQAWAEAPEGAPQPINPYPIGSDAHAFWRTALQRWILQYSAAEGSESSA